MLICASDADLSVRSRKPSGHGMTWHGIAEVKKTAASRHHAKLICWWFCLSWELPSTYVIGYVLYPVWSSTKVRREEKQ